jgi:hypothetical protein
VSPNVNFDIVDAETVAQDESILKVSSCASALVVDEDGKAIIGVVRAFKLMNGDAKSELVALLQVFAESLKKVKKLRPSSDKFAQKVCGSGYAYFVVIRNDVTGAIQPYAYKQHLKDTKAGEEATQAFDLESEAISARYNGTINLGCYCVHL